MSLAGIVRRTSRMASGMGGPAPYVIGIATSSAAVVARLVLNPILDRAPYVPFALAVMMAARFGGRLSAFVATALSALGMAWFFLEPYHSFPIANTDAAWGLALFIVLGSSISLLVGQLHASLSSTARSEAILRESEERFRALSTASSDVLFRMTPDWSEMSNLSGGVLSPAPKALVAAGFSDIFLPMSSRVSSRRSVKPFGPGRFLNWNIGSYAPTELWVGPFRGRSRCRMPVVKSLNGSAPLATSPNANARKKPYGSRPNSGDLH